MSESSHGRSRHPWHRPSLGRGVTAMSASKEALIPPARPIIGDAEIEAAVRVLRSGRVVQGPEVAAFEDEFSALVAGRHCVAVNSGTSALQLTLMALGLG